MLNTRREHGRSLEPPSKPHPASPERQGGGKGQGSGVRGHMGAAVYLGSEGTTQGWTGRWLGPPTGHRSPCHAQTQAQDGTMATHRTPSLRLKSSWSGSPLRWKTAITPLWMLRAGKEACCRPGAPRHPPFPLLSGQEQGAGPFRKRDPVCPQPGFPPCATRPPSASPVPPTDSASLPVFVNPLHPATNYGAPSAGLSHPQT